MYLTRKQYVKKWDHTPADERFNITITRGNVPIDSSRLRDLIFEECYWRKANAIHKWFVDNVQDGVDDCGEYLASIEKLTELRDLCSKVLATAKIEEGKVANGYTLSSTGAREYDYVDGTVVVNAEEISKLLPCQEGFFFGSTDYDEGYISDIRHTRDELDRILTSTYSSSDFYYHSSW